MECHACALSSTLKRNGSRDARLCPSSRENQVLSPDILYAVNLSASPQLVVFHRDNAKHIIGQKTV